MYAPKIPPSFDFIMIKDGPPYPKLKIEVDEKKNHQLECIAFSSVTKDIANKYIDANDYFNKVYSIYYQVWKI